MYSVISGARLLSDARGCCGRGRRLRLEGNERTTSINDRRCRWGRDWRRGVRGNARARAIQHYYYYLRHVAN